MRQSSRFAPGVDAAEEKQFRL